MQDLIIAQQHVRRRRQVLALPSPTKLERNFASARLQRRPRGGSSRVEARQRVSQGKGKRPLWLLVVLIFLICSLSAAVAAFGFPSFGSPPISSATNDPFYQRAMLSYTGIATLRGEPVDAGDGTPLDMVESFSWETYTVRPGDSISSLAASRSLSIDSIIALNGVTNVKRLQVGTELRIPNMDGVPYTVRKGDSLGRIAASWGIPLDAILDANDLSSDTIIPGATLFLPGARMRGNDLKMALGELFIYPIRGPLTSGFGWRDDPFTGARRFHAAIDLAAPIGTPVRASMDGKVAVLGVNSVYGKYIILTHDGGYQTMYAHLSAYRSVKGARVTQGERIADVGNTGMSTGPHLHFAVYRNGRAVNPLQFLEK